MLSVLKLIPNISLYLVLWGLSAFGLKKSEHKMATGYIAIGVVVFLMCATNYLPKKLIHGIEKTYLPMEINQLNPKKSYHIHVLGAGATLDPRLPASMNLAPTTLTRLVEGIRIYGLVKEGVLVTSAAAKKGTKSQAKLAREAAVSLGVKKEAIVMLEQPTTTLEEAMAFKAQFGTDKTVILVTSALHMPRAVEIFRDQGLTVLPAPTDFMYKEDGNTYNGLTLPSMESLRLMNTYHLTVLKLWYYRIFFK